MNGLTRRPAPAGWIIYADVFPGLWFGFGRGFGLWWLNIGPLQIGWKRATA